MNIAYACDNNYIAHTGISILSLLENNIEIDNIRIYLISVNISEENQTKIRQLVESFNREFVLIPFKELCPNLKLSNVGRHIETVYAKLFFGNIKNVDKIIYLDSDIIINNSLEEMWNLDLNDNYFGLVKTITKDYTEKLGLLGSEPFYNDGVAIVNSKKLRDDRMEEKFLNFIDAYDGNPPVLSEGTINVVCKGKIKTIHPKFNYGSSFLMYKNKSLSVIANEQEYYSDKIINEARNNPVVIHYLCGWFKRPWEIGCSHPLRGKYEKFKNKSIWKDEPLLYKSLPKNVIFLKFISGFLPINVVWSIIQIYRKLK